MYILVPAHPGCPGQSPQSRKMVVCVLCGAKSDVIFLLSDPKFPQDWWNFAPISLSFRDLTWERQTDRQRDNRQTKDAVIETEGSHTVNVQA